MVLCSKHPDGVLLETYGYLYTHYAIRRLMHDAALNADLDPDRLSFTRGLRGRPPQHPLPPGIFAPRASSQHVNKQSAKSSPSRSRSGAYAPTRAWSNAK